MEQSAESCYQAYASRDPRFDGVFFIGVTSTGIYCRPICPARTPKASNCRFYDSAEAAEKDSFRPCLRCRPELAPGSAPVDDARRIAHLLMQRIGNGLIDCGGGLEAIADQFDLSSRQIRRIVQKELGVSPIELIQTRRLLLAKQLLTETALPVTEVAFASGFSSLRRFNDAFQTRYGMAPSRLRKEAAQRGSDPAASDTSVLQISYRPPYDWVGILNFLSRRTIKSVEWVTAESYARTIRLGRHTGWIRLTHAPGKNALMMEFAHSLTPVLPALMSRVRHLFDLNARPDVISAHLQKDSLLKNAVLRNPGLRVPGAFDGFELAVRAILGQQVTVKAATTLARRLMEAYGDPIETPFAELSCLSPLPEKLAKLDTGDIAKYGIVSSRAKSILTLAQSAASGALTLEPGMQPMKAVAQLHALPGIGPWTAHYIAVRALRWPDGFPKDDIAIRNNLGGVSAKEADAMSQAWRPWRSYAVLHIWNGL
ncbi:MAG: helix-turn-helix domain-containing protein [Bryobacterales bacterium]|nr:helix-turn-helix domain-containing protein [Bryobacterales bacterium]